MSSAYIDSGATHHFFHSRKVFVNHSRKFEGVKPASGVSKLVGKAQVWIPFGGDMYIDAYHAPHFSFIVLSVGVLSADFIVAFMDSIRQ